MSWVGLIPVTRRLRLVLRLRNLEPLRIGAGRESGALGSSVDLPVYRQTVVRNRKIMEEPVIPGSSFKGVLRTAVMTLLASCGLKAHSGVKDDNCVSEIYGNHRAFDAFRGRVSADTVRGVLLGFCPACLMFGAPSLAGRIRVGDFLPTGPVRVGVKTGVGINRRTGAAQPKVLYTVEYVEPGAEFKGVIDAVNIPNWMLALLAEAVLMIGSGWLKLGGFKSRGMGRVEITGASLSVKDAAGGCLGPLDQEVDESLSLPGCSCSREGLDARLECSGGAGLDALRVLGEAWFSKYCSRLAEVYPTRRGNAENLVEAFSFEESE